MSLEQLYRDKRKSLIYKIIRYTGSYQEAEDIVQEAFIKALSSLPTYNPEKGSLATWFNKVLFSVLWAQKRKNKKCSLVSFDDFLALEGGIITPETDSIKDIDMAFSSVLNEKHRDILLSFYRQGYTVKEISTKYCQTQDSVRKVIQRFKHE